jgi:DNA polymerase sigma
LSEVHPIKNEIVHQIS